MRTILLTVICLFSALFAQAQNEAALKAIEQANAPIKSLQAHFVQTQKQVAKEKTTRMEGTLYLADADKMVMHYDAPSTDLLVINGDYFYMTRGKRNKLYNTAKNVTMRRLSNTLLLCLHGKPGQLATETESAITVEKGAKAYTVTLTTEKKQVRGYAKIVLTYDLRTKLLTKMQMDEFNGNTTTYEMSGAKTNGAIDPAVFNVPKEKK